MDQAFDNALLSCKPRWLREQRNAAAGASRHYGPMIAVRYGERAS
jgi:hypothetical protein